MNFENQSTSIRKATTINFFGNYTNVFIQILYGAILARLLTPEDFGVVAVVTVFTSFFTLIANMGIGPAIIQNKDIKKKDIDSIFSFTLYLGLIIGVLFAIFSIPLSIFYDNQIYIGIGSLLAISLFFNTLNTVPNAVLLKAHKFKLVNIRLVIVSILAAIPTIILALNGFKYYSIVIHSILVSFITLLWNLITVKPKFLFIINKESIIKIKEFSSYQFAFSLINYFSRNLDNLLIGKFIGGSALGLYDKSYRLMLYSIQNLTHVISPVLHPILSAHQDDKEYIYVKYMKVVKILSLLGVFVSVYSFFAAEEIIILLYGNQWFDSIPSFRFLALSIWAQMVTSSTGSIFQSLGKPKLLFKSGFISAVLIISSILIGISFKNVNAVAASVSIALNINFFITMYILINKGLDQSLLKFIKKLLPEVLIFAIVFTGLFIVQQFNFQNLLISSIYKLIIGGVLYYFALLITNQLRYLSIIWEKSMKKSKKS